MSGKERPVMKVVRLLKDLAAELEKEKAEDEAVFESLDCWCKTNEKEKTQAIAVGKAKMAELKSAQEEFMAKIEELRGSIAETRAKLQEDQEALDKATAIRMQESKAFHSEETELMGIVQSCKQAILVLSKHHPSLEQLRSVAKNLEALKTMAVAKDTLGHDKMAVLRAFLQQAEDSSTNNRLRRIPGMQSYEPQSGQIFGVLKQMQEEFEASLSTAQQEEMRAKEEFEEVRTAKQAELEAGEKKLKQLRQDDAMFRDKNQQAYEEYNDTREQVETDETFLRNLQKKCSQTDEDYAKRTKSRNEEIEAVQDTIEYLNTDAAFDNFEKTVNSASFLQTRESQSAAGRARRDRAARILRAVGTPGLAMLATTVQLDAFTKVKAAIDKMVAELSAQQQDEVKHRDWCKTEMAKNERETAANYDKKESLESDISDFKQSIKELTKEIKVKTEEIAEMQKQMKKASEIREGEAAEFQVAVTDHALTQQILNKALQRMKEVYALAQVSAHQPGAPHIQTSGTDTDPGNGPARFSKYEKNAKGGQVVEMIETIIADTKKAEDDIRAAELDAASAYETFMQESNASIEKYQAGIVDMTESKAKAEDGLVLAEGDLKATFKELESLNSELGDLRESCDYLLKNFDARQEARATEISALREAKAILSGA